MDFNAKTNPGRESRLQQLEEDKVWDVLIIGGGATGAGIAVDAAARGFSTVLFDTQDFSEGTSSRSTKLIHGGVRYMKNPRDWKLGRGDDRTQIAFGQRTAYCPSGAVHSSLLREL